MESTFDRDNIPRNVVSNSLQFSTNKKSEFKNV